MNKNRCYYRIKRYRERKKALENLKVNFMLLLGIKRETLEEMEERHEKQVARLYLEFFISSSSPLTYTKGHPAPPHPIWGIKRSRAIALSSTNFRFSLEKFRHLIFILLVPSVLDTNVIFSILFPFCQLAF